MSEVQQESEETTPTQSQPEQTEEMNAKLLDLCRRGEAAEFLTILKTATQLNLDIVDESGWSPLIQAAFGGHVAIVSEIISFQRQSLKEAGKSDEEVQEGIKKLLCRKVRFNGTTALHLASAGGHQAIVKLLLNEDKDSIIDAADYDLATPLHCAVLTQHYQIANILLMNGATINKKDVREKTPLDWAIERGQGDFMALFHKYHFSNASPECEQETGLDIVGDNELHSKIVDNILLEEQKAVEVGGGELNMGVFEEFNNLDFTNCDQDPLLPPAGGALHPFLMPFQPIGDERSLSCPPGPPSNHGPHGQHLSWPPTPGPQSNQMHFDQRLVEIAPRHARYNKQMDEMRNMSGSLPPSRSCSPEQKEQDTNAILFESRYMKARCDALEKEKAGSNQQFEAARNEWRQRESVLMRQVDGQQKEISELRHRLHRMRTFLDKLPANVRRQFRGNENEPGNNAADRRAQYNKYDVAEMPQRGGSKKNRRRNHGHKKRNNKNYNKQQMVDSSRSFEKLST